MTNGNVHVSKSMKIKITWSQMFIDIYPASKAQKRNGTKDRIINSNDITNGTKFENWRWSKRRGNTICWRIFRKELKKKFFSNLKKNHPSRSHTALNTQTNVIRIFSKFDALIDGATVISQCYFSIDRHPKNEKPLS